MKNYKDELIKFCNDVTETDYVRKENKENWMFGAIQFAFGAGLVSKEDKEEINQKYHLWGDQ